MYRLMYLGTKRCTKVKYFVSLDLALFWLEPGLGCLRSHNLKMRGWGRFLQAARCEWTGEVPSLPRWFKWMRSGGSWGSAKVGWDGDGRYARPGGLATCDSCTPAQSKVTKDRDPETQRLRCLTGVGVNQRLGWRKDSLVPRLRQIVPV